MRTVLCRGYGQKLERPAAPPFPCTAGEAIYRDAARRTRQGRPGLQKLVERLPPGDFP